MKPTTMNALRSFALQFSDTEEGVACAGTAVESITVKRKNKAFLFLRAIDMRVKLNASLKEATALAAQEPARYSVGANGWVLVKFDGTSEPGDVLKRWIEESHSLVGVSKSAPKKAVKRTKTKKKVD